MRLLYVIIVLFAVQSKVFSEHEFLFEPGNSTTTDTIKIDTSSNPVLQKLFGLSPSLKLYYCEMVYVTKGEIFTMECLNTLTGQLTPEAWSMIKRAHKGDKIIFDNMYVIKGEKKLKYPIDKLFIVP